MVLANAGWRDSIPRQVINEPLVVPVIEVGEVQRDIAILSVRGQGITSQVDGSTNRRLVNKVRSNRSKGAEDSRHHERRHALRRE